MHLLENLSARKASGQEKQGIAHLVDVHLVHIPMEWLRLALVSGVLFLHRHQ